MQETRQRIIHAAIDLFAENGYKETNMRSIAQNANIKAASIYNHFSSKGEIFTCILDMYIDFTKETTVSDDEIDRLIETENAEDILHRMFFSFSEEERGIYLKILKIILHEQYREPEAMDFMRNHYMKDSIAYIKSILDKMLAKGMIVRTETGYYAKIFAALSLFASEEAMFYDWDEYMAMDRITRREINEFLIKQIVYG